VNGRAPRVASNFPPLLFWCTQSPMSSFVSFFCFKIFSISACWSFPSFYLNTGQMLGVAIKLSCFRSVPLFLSVGLVSLEFCTSFLPSLPSSRIIVLSPPLTLKPFSPNLVYTTPKNERSVPSWNFRPLPSPLPSSVSPQRLVIFPLMKVQGCSILICNCRRYLPPLFRLPEHRAPHSPVVLEFLHSRHYPFILRQYRKASLNPHLALQSPQSTSFPSHTQRGLFFFLLH